MSLQAEKIKTLTEQLDMLAYSAFCFMDSPENNDLKIVLLNTLRQLGFCPGCWSKDCECSYD